MRVFYKKFVMNYDRRPAASSAVSSHMSDSSSSLKEAKKGCSMDRALLVRWRLPRLRLLLLLLLPKAWKLCLCSCMQAATAFRHPISDGGSDDRDAGQSLESTDGREADRRSLLRFMHGSAR